jgi:hypothetical protein
MNSEKQERERYQRFRASQLAFAAINPKSEIEMGSARDRRDGCARTDPGASAVLPMNLPGLISVPALGAALASGSFSGWRDTGRGD